jgi:hypothetical protein
MPAFAGCIQLKIKDIACIANFCRFDKNRLAVGLLPTATKLPAMKRRETREYWFPFWPLLHGINYPQFRIAA